HRSKVFADDATPAGNGIAARVLLRMGHLLGEPRYLAAAERTLRAAWPALAQHPQAHVSLVTALEELLDPPEFVILRGEARTIEGWRVELARQYAPRRVVLAIAAQTPDLPPALADKTSRAAPVAYVCRGSSCAAPGDALEAAVNPERQPEAGAADRLEHLRQLPAAIARHVQDRSELLAFELIEAAQLEQLWRKEMSRRQAGIELAGVQQFRLGAHARGMLLQALLRGLRDHRTNIGCQIRRRADLETAHRADEHRDHALGDLLLQVQYATRRAALACARKSRGDDVVDHLLGQRGRIDHHRVDAAGLGDERHDRTVAIGEGAVDGGGGRGRARER